MTFKEAAARIEEHNIIHQAHEPNAVKITEALEMATKLLLWADEQPKLLFECDIVDVLYECYNNGYSAGFNRAKKVYHIKD